MTMDGQLENPCLDSQRLAAFADRRLRRSEIPEVLAHLDSCASCRSALETAIELRSPTQSFGWQKMALAASIAIVIASAAYFRGVIFRSPADRLVSLAPPLERVVEARLSGGFAWAPYRGPLRSADSVSEARRMKLVGVAGELVEQADADHTAATQHVAGLGLLLVDRPEDAITRLRAAAEASSGAAAPWSDLAAAEYATALRLGRPSLYPVALSHADRALAVDANLKEALFNRALILERLGLTQIARAAWSRYLIADPSSRWADEARQHLRRLSDTTDESLFKRDQPSMENAAIQGNQQSVDRFVDRYRQQSRTWAEAEYLGRWAAAFHRGDSDDAARQLAIAGAISRSLERLSGEGLLADAVNAVIAASPQRRAMIANAHLSYRLGRIAYGRHEPVAAEPELRRAAVLFENAQTPMALVARYFAANTRYDQNDVVRARRELEALRDETSTRPRYLALGAQIRWELTLCAMLDDDWSAALVLASEGAERFRKLGERSNLAVLQMMQATTLISLGKPDDGWAQRIQAFALHSAEGRGDQVPLSVGEAARIELRNGRLDSARALLGLEEAAHRAAGDDVQLSNALMREAMIAATAGATGDAPQYAREAMTAARRIADASLRERAVADANLAAGAVALQTESRRANELLSLAIDHYRVTDKAFYLPDALLMRARASMRLGRGDAALRDLQEGIDEVERHRRVVAGSIVGTGVLDARRALFREIVGLCLDRGDVAGAFAAAERSRGRLSFGGEASTDVVTLQSRLAGKEAVVLELMVLPGELVAFVVAPRRLGVSRTPITASSLDALIGPQDDAADRAWYDLFIRPSEASLNVARKLIVVADASLQQVCFAALLDSTTNRRLIERMPVAMAPNAGSLKLDELAVPASVLAIALPSGERAGTAALPEGAAELADIRGVYAKAVEIDAERATVSAFTAAAPAAAVIHITGHTERQPGLGDAALLFRGAGAAVEPVTWSRIAELNLGQPVVVLAACETLRVPPSPQAHTLSLAAGFIAAGARAVIGTLTPVSDNESRLIFGLVHRRLARGESPATALQQAQLEAIAAGHPGWRSVAVITNRI